MLSRSRVGRSDDKLELREAGSSGGLDGITFALLQHTQLTAHAPTPFSGQARFSFLVSRKMFGKPSVRDTARQEVFYWREDSRAQFSFGGWRGVVATNE
jgi:hypothetical protein